MQLIKNRNQIIDEQQITTTTTNLSDSKQAYHMLASTNCCTLTMGTKNSNCNKA